jgi:hypothetical protein
MVMVFELGGDDADDAPVPVFRAKDKAPVAPVEVPRLDALFGVLEDAFSVRCRWLRS